MTEQETRPRFARPVHEVRIGLVRAAVWGNRGEKGVRHQVTFERRYRHGEEWKTATSFGVEDLLTLAKAANEAHSWITGQRQLAKASEGAAEASSDPQRTATPTEAPGQRPLSLPGSVPGRWKQPKEGGRHAKS